MIKLKQNSFIQKLLLDLYGCGCASEKILKELVK